MGQLVPLHFGGSPAPGGVGSGGGRPVDPAVGALGQALARSGVVRACLTAVERVSLADLILPTDRAASQLAATRAALSLLVGAVQVGIQLTHVGP
jgi:hypothetical protein